MKEKEEKSGTGLLWLILILILIVIIVFGFKLLSGNGETQANINQTAETENISETETFETEATAPPETEEPTEAEVLTVSVNDSDVYSQTARLSDLNGNMIYGKNEDLQIYPASLTKIMTVIVALEKIDYLDEKVIIPGDIYEYIEYEEASTAGFSAYESVTYRDLLYGALLSSGAECCLTLAEYISGSEDAFVYLMNEKAQELGMEDTHFTNSVGLHNYNHYSTASDISKLLIYALDNEEFCKIFTSQNYYTETDYNPYGVTLYSTMFSELNSDEFVGGAFLGGKTGYTSEAGLCLASLAEIDGDKYILVTTGAEGTHYTEPLHIYDHVNIYEALSKEKNPDLFIDNEVTEPTVEDYNSYYYDYDVNNYDDYEEDSYYDDYNYNDGYNNEDYNEDQYYEDSEYYYDYYN